MSDSQRPLQILLIGSGGVGTIASVALESTNGASQVTSVLRSDYEKVTKSGFEINSIDHGNLKNWKPTNIVNSVEAGVELLQSKGYTTFDYILIVTKNLPELVKTADLIRPAMIKKKQEEDNNNGSKLVYPTVVLIQNGIGIEQPIIDEYPEAVVLSGVSMIGSHNFGGRIEQYEHDILAIGYYNPACKTLCHPSLAKPQDTSSSENAYPYSVDFLEQEAHKFIDLYNTCGRVSCSYVADLIRARWRKLVYNSAINTICSLIQVDVGRCFLSSLDTSIIIPAMQEVLAIAKSSGYDLLKDEPDLCDKMLRADEGLYYKPSMQIDEEKGNPVELEVILGAPLRIARQNGVDAPVLTVVYNLLKGVQFRLLEKKGYFTLPEKGPMFTDKRFDKFNFPSEFPIKK